MREPLMRAVTGAGFFVIGILSGTSSDAQFPEIAEGERYILQTRVVNGDTGEPAAGVEVSWIGYRGEEQCIISAADGSLAAPLVGVFGWNTLLYGRRDGLVTQALFLLGEASLRTELVLGPPASLTGTIQREDGKPLEGGTVTLKANLRSGKAHFEARTDGSGRYLVEHLPPGQYYLQVRHDEYFAPLPEGPPPPIRVDLIAGDVSHHNFILQEKAHGVGKVIAPDGTGAGSVEFNLPVDSENRSQMKVTTDEVGNFEVDFVPGKRAGYTVSIDSETLGSGSFQLPSAMPGELVKDLVVQLHGVARVSGTVRGPNGEPVVEARVDGAKTDESGHYDTGFVALPAKGNMKVSIVPPVWTGARSASRLNPVAPLLEPDAVYYKDNAFTLPAKHGDVLNKDVVLERIPVRSLRGVIQDANGVPAAHATVALYAGPAPARQWLEELAPFTPRPPARQPQIPRQTIDSYQPALLLARVQTDDLGQWEVWVLSENKSFSWLTGESYMNLQELTIAVADATLEYTTVKRLEHADAGDDPIETNLLLEPIPDDLVTHAYVMDESGAPLPGVAWRLNEINGPFSSDKEGRVTLPRLASRLELSLVDSTLQVLSAAASGEIVRPPVPKSDPDPRDSADFGGLEFTYSGPGIGKEAPYIKSSKRIVSYSEFDTSKGKMRITVGQADSVAAGR